MAAKITHQGNWQLSSGKLTRVEAFPNNTGTQQLILTVSMHKNAVTQFATMTCHDVGDSALVISKIIDPNVLQTDDQDGLASLNTLKKCLNKKINVLLRKNQNHWQTVGIGRLGALNSSWFFVEGETDEMISHVREEHLRMLPGLLKTHIGRTKI